jgi:hypothetical protein
MINFATCERKRALSYIQQVYPSKAITDTPDSAGSLLDLVEQDLVRIQDPMMHGSRIAVIPGGKYKEDAEMRAKIVAACKIFA